jgi:hypothetical protein
VLAWLFFRSSFFSLRNACSIARVFFLWRSFFSLVIFCFFLQLFFYCFDVLFLKFVFCSKPFVYWALSAFSTKKISSINK